MTDPSGTHTLIIAEAGVNHCGSLDMAKRLVDAAADAGADYVKFQTFEASKLVGADAAMADYQKANTGSNDSQLNMLRSLQLSRDDHFALIDHCRKRNIKFMSTAFDDISTEFLSSLKLDFWKIPSGEITNVPYLRRIAAERARVIMSTGMCDDSDIEAALHVLEAAGQPMHLVTLLHCNTMYPTPMTDVNLRAMVEMSHRFRLPVGYSDHTQGIEVPVAAVALGATVIEKHFTLDHSLPGPDHKASLLPHQLKDMVEAIRNIELALGTATKRVTPSEAANRAVARKSIVAARHIAKGEPFTEENITTRRPGSGISPLLWDKILTLTATKDFDAGQQIVL